MICFTRLSAFRRPIPSASCLCLRFWAFLNWEWQRRYFDEDVIGRCVGKVCDPVEAMRQVAHSIDPSVPEERIIAAVESRNRRFERGLVEVEAGMLKALAQLREAGIRTAIVSDAGADDMVAWPRSPLATSVDTAVFSYEVGVRKPDRRIYERALASLEVEPDEAYFVGDGGSDEHRGAKAVGMRTVLVTRLFALWWPEKVASRRQHTDFEFTDVAEFVEALGLKNEEPRDR